MIRSTAGFSVVTNTYEAHPEGSSFVVVLDPAGEPVGQFEAGEWGDPERAGKVMAEIWRLASSGWVEWTVGYGHEYVFAVSDAYQDRDVAGYVRCDVTGTVVRCLDADGNDAAGGSAYWMDDEWVEDPELVMGAILGCAQGMETGNGAVECFVSDLDEPSTAEVDHDQEDLA